MNNDLDRLQAMLDRATAAQEASDELLDTETVLLREGWMALGQLLEAAQPREMPSIEPWSMPPPAASSPLKKGTGSEPTSENQAKNTGCEAPVPLLQRAAGRRWLPTVAVALAASLLVGVMAVWMLTTANLPETPVPRQTATLPNRPTEPKVETPAVVAANDELKWDDSIDEQLVEVSRDITYAQANHRQWGNTLGMMQYEIEQVRMDVQLDKF